jgi:3-phytase
MRHVADGDRDHAVDPLRMRTVFRSHLVKIAAFMVACVLVAWQLWSAPLSAPGNTRGRTAIPVRATVETDPVQSSGDAADDPVIWRHPIDGAESTIIGTDKKRGLMVYDLNGRILQELPDGKLGNVDLRHGFPLGGSPTAIVTAGNRTDDSIAIYAIDVATRRLRNIAARRLGVDFSVYGSCMYRSAVNGAYYVFITSKSGEVGQWRLLETSRGTVDAEPVRTFDVGSQIEACVADDELGFLYIGEERVGIWKYAAEPTGGDGRIGVDSTGPTGFLTPDVEGLAIFFGSAGTGYLIASSQGRDAFNVYRREAPNEYVATFAIEEGNGIDRVTHSDGVDVLNASLGPRFPDGVFVTQDQQNEGGRQNFKLVPWPAIEAVIRQTSGAQPTSPTAVPRLQGLLDKGRIGGLRQSTSNR